MLRNEVVVHQLLVLVYIAVMGASQLIVELSLVSLVRSATITVSTLLNILELLEGETVSTNLSFWDDEAVPV